MAGGWGSLAAASAPEPQPADHSCPACGQLLATGPRGQLYCPFGDWPKPKITGE